MKLSELKIVSLPIDSLIPYSNNARTHSTEQVAKIASSIKEFGFNDPIAIDKDNGIIAGHGRLLAARLLALTHVPTIQLGHLNKEQQKAYILAHNRIAIDAGWDSELLQIELQELKNAGFDLAETGFDASELEKIMNPEILTPGLGDEDSVPELPIEPITKLGDVWILGNHRLMCGDSTMIDSVENLMKGEKADIGFTSPPYNANKNAGGLIEKKYKDDEDAKSDDDYLKFLIDFTLNSIVHAKYSFVNIQMLSHNKLPLFDYQHHFKMNIKDILVWVKNIAPPQINKGTFNSKWEYVYCFSDESKSRSFPCEWRGQYPNVIDAKNGSQNEFAKVHKATFSVEFPLWIIEKMDFAKSVLDLFGGTGSTLIACEKTNRKCYMMELSPNYCDVIIKRWEEFTGKKATLETYGLSFEDVANGRKV